MLKDLAANLDWYSQQCWFLSDILLHHLANEDMKKEWITRVHRCLGDFNLSDVAHGDWTPPEYELEMPRYGTWLGDIHTTPWALQMFPQWLSTRRDLDETLSATGVKKFAKEMGLQKGTSNLRLLQTYLKSNLDSSTREDTENPEHEEDIEDMFDAGG